jgi:hypothetical protein
MMPLRELFLQASLITLVAICIHSIASRGALNAVFARCSSLIGVCVHWPELP